MSRTVDWGGTEENSEKYEEKAGRSKRAEREERSQHADIIQGNPGLRLHGPAGGGPFRPFPTGNNTLRTPLSFICTPSL